MSSRRSSGFTLAELVIAIVVIGIGLAGVLSAFDTAVRSSADPLVRKQMLAVAEEMLEEILLKPYAAGTGTISGCDRSNADDIADYNGYSQSVCDIDGNAVAGLAGYAVGVTVDSAATLGTLGGGAVSKVTVVVTFGSEALTLVGWRTDYAS